MSMKPDDDIISSTAPPFSLREVIRTLREKGFTGAIDDPEQGPHVHLTLLLVTVLVVSTGIILITKFMI